MVQAGDLHAEWVQLPVFPTVMGVFECNHVMVVGQAVSRAQICSSAY